MKVTIEFSDEWEFRAFWEEHERGRIAALVLGELRGELRDTNKHGEPTPRDIHWYDRYWAICQENDIDGWSL